MIFINFSIDTGKSYAFKFAYNKLTTVNCVKLLWTQGGCSSGGGCSSSGRSGGRSSGRW